MGSSRLHEVLDRIDAYGREGHFPLVVFDLDSTLFSTGPRNLRILHEFARDHAGRWPQLPELAASLRPGDLGWNPRDCLKERGVEDAELFGALKSFWYRRFFSDEYLAHDLPVPGASDFVSGCHARGAMIYYLTGRHAGSGTEAGGSAGEMEPGAHASGMEAGTLRALLAHGFPSGGDRCILHLKPSFGLPDRAFKDGALADIRSRCARVVATFENEPAHANLFLRAFPEALHFLLLTIHSPRAEEPAPELVRSQDFLLP